SMGVNAALPNKPQSSDVADTNENSGSGTIAVDVIHSDSLPNSPPAASGANGSGCIAGVGGGVGSASTRLSLAGFSRRSSRTLASQRSCIPGKDAATLTSESPSSMTLHFKPSTDATMNLSLPAV